MEDVRISDDPAPVNADTVGELTKCRSFAIDSRCISRDIVEQFGITMGFDEDGRAASHHYPYHDRLGNIIGYKVRQLPKDFRVVGTTRGAQLFGQQRCSNGKTLVITEGELDACAVAQAQYDHYGKIYPVVSIPSASQTKPILEQREWLQSFESIVLFFDADEAGEKATETVAKLLPSGKVKVARALAWKDPSEALCKGGKQAILDAIWNARPWNPAGIVMGEEIWKQYAARKEVESVPYPKCMASLNDKLQGIRHGEITLFTSGTGSGKSTVIKEIVLDLLNTTNARIGLISLEESVGDTAEKFISMQLRRPVMDPPPVEEDEEKEAFNSVFGDERLVLLDHQGSVGDSSLIDKIEYMAQMGCEYLVLDHITIAVSEGSEGLSGNEAVDKVMSDLLKVVKRYNVWLGLVSHLRKAMGGRSFEEGNLASIDDIKGSGSIKQISFDIVAFARNLVAENEMERNTIRFRVLKSRFTGKTGDAGAAVYEPSTCRLHVAGEFTYE